MTRRTPPDAGTQGPLLFRLLLRLFPADFRARFGAEILETYTEHWLATAHSPRARCAFVFRSIVDATSSAALEHLSSANATRRDRRSPSFQTTMTSLSRDLSFALRSLARRPGLVATIVLTLALGIGANTAIFSLTDAVLLRPLSIHEPERVVRVMKARSETSRFGNFAYPHYQTLADRAESFSQLAVGVTTELAVEGGDRHEQLMAGLVTGNYFSMLSLTPTVGGFFREEDTRVPGASPHVVLSHAYWSSHFGADPEAVGRTVRIAGNPFTVVGVAPRGFHGLELAAVPAIWVPLSMHESLASPVYSNAEALETPYLEFFHVTGRLRPDVTSVQAEAELNALFARISETEAASGPAFTPPTLESPIWLSPAVESAAMADREDLLRFIRLLVGTAILTLLLACVNVANLLLVRGSERTAELGVRIALGASRVRVVRQLFVESLLLALGGAVTGVAVGAAVVRLISSFTLPGGIWLTHLSLGLDVRVLAFTSGLAILTSLVFGILPAISASRVDPSTVLRSSTGRSSARTPGSTLLGAQAAISLVLLTGAALFLRSLQAGLTTDIGFDPAPLVAVSMEPRLTGATGEQGHQMYRDAVESVARVPGVTSVAVGTHVPLAPTMRLPFRTTSDADAAPPAISAGLASVMPGYFETLGVPLNAGRDFTVDDDERVGRVAILNESGARTFFGNLPPLGREIELFTIKYTVVGVVHDTKYGSVRDDALPFVYVSLAQERNVGAVSIIARSASPSATLPLMRIALRDVAALVPVRDARLVARQVDAVLMPQRFGATLLTLFGLVALTITAVGIYGTVSLAVNQRTTEIGIRSALGAGHGHIVKLVLWRTGVAILIGSVVGGAAAFLGSRAAEHFLYGIARTDMLAFGAAAGVLMATALVVAMGPARRATRIDPVLAMRSE